MSKELDRETKEASQSIASEIAHGDQKIKELQSKLDRLLDAHLDGAVDKREYQAKKEALLSFQVTLKERKATMEGGAMRRTALVLVLRALSCVAIAVELAHPACAAVGRAAAVRVVCSRWR